MFNFHLWYTNLNHKNPVFHLLYLTAYWADWCNILSTLTRYYFPLFIHGNMVLMLMVRAIALRIIVLLLQQHFFFQNGSHVHNNFKPAHGGLSKPLADIYFSVFVPFLGVNKRCSTPTSYPLHYKYGFASSPTSLGLLLSGDIQRNPVRSYKS